MLTAFVDRIVRAALATVITTIIAWVIHRFVSSQQSSDTQLQ